MFRVNGIKMRWRENFSVRELLEEIKENKKILPVSGHGQVIIVNGEILSSIKKNDYIISDNDEIKVLPLMGGG